MNVIAEARNVSGDAVGGNRPAFPASLLSFILVAKFLGVPADPAQIAHDHGTPGEGYRLEDLARIAKRLNIVARIKPAALAELHKVPLPALAELNDGEAAILFLKRKLPDLLLLDLQMPGTDGFGVLSYIQKNKQELPVILLSGLPPDQIQKSMQRLPSRDLPPLLLKPVDPTQLLNIVALRLTGELPS